MRDVCEVNASAREREGKGQQQHNMSTWVVACSPGRSVLIVNWPVGSTSKPMYKTRLRVFGNTASSSKNGADCAARTTGVGQCTELWVG
jgi:hypothetical protein